MYTGGPQRVEKLSHLIVIKIGFLQLKNNSNAGLPGNR